jgi:hypothetical protein
VQTRFINIYATVPDDPIPSHVAMSPTIEKHIEAVAWMLDQPDGDRWRPLTVAMCEAGVDMASPGGDYTATLTLTQEQAHARLLRVAGASDAAIALAYELLLDHGQERHTTGLRQGHYNGYRQGYAVGCRDSAGR